MRAPKKTPPTPSAVVQQPLVKPDAATAQYDQLTLTLNEADTLANHLVVRLAEMSETETSHDELYALSVIAQAIADKHDQVLQNAVALLGVVTDRGAR